jgi:hypothetical protein
VIGQIEMETTLNDVLAPASGARDGLSGIPKTANQCTAEQAIRTYD